MFIALNIDAPENVIDVVEDVFESNDAISTDEGFNLEPISIDEPTYETVEIEIQEIEIAEIEIEVTDIETEVETEIELEIEESIDEPIEVENTDQEEQSEPETESNEEEKQEKVEVASKEKENQPEKIEEEKEEVEESKTVEKKESSKEKAVKKIMKKIDDKKRYDDVAQTKTLVVMQVLVDSKNFFESQIALNDRVDFFTNDTLPDATINDNNIASYLLFAGSDGLMNDLIDSQWQTDLE
jgi:outer membrane biosynthesis protein TonB